MELTPCGNEQEYKYWAAVSYTCIDRRFIPVSLRSGPHRQLRLPFEREKKLNPLAFDSSSSLTRSCPLLYRAPSPPLFLTTWVRATAVLPHPPPCNLACPSMILLISPSSCLCCPPSAAVIFTNKIKRCSHFGNTNVTTIILSVVLFG